VIRAVAFLFPVLTLALLLAPGFAEACAVCAPTDVEEVRTAFIVSTAFMTFFPLMVLGSVAWWIRSRYKAMDAAYAAASVDSSSS
jgi:hypothetical protein